MVPGVAKMPLPTTRDMARMYALGHVRVRGREGVDVVVRPMDASSREEEEDEDEEEGGRASLEMLDAEALRSCG